MIVVDASAVMALLLALPAAEHIERQIAAHDYALHAPHLLDVEILSALRRAVAGGEASAGRAGEALEDLLVLPLERYPHDVLARRTWALRDNFSAYDATYVALAETLTGEGAPLLTVDGRLARAAREHTAVNVLLAG